MPELPAGSLAWADASSRYTDVLVYTRHNRTAADQLPISEVQTYEPVLV